MEGALVPVTTALVPPSFRRLVEAWLAGRGEATIRAYRADLEDFRSFLNAASIDEAAEGLLGRGHGAANETALAYRADLLRREMAAATVNRRLAAIRSIVKLARTLGLVPWSLEVPGSKSDPYRDTRGPGTDGVRRLLQQARSGGGPKSIRDVAILRLAFDLALRRKEIVGLDLEDLDLEGGTMAVLGKGRSEKVSMTLPAPTAAALREWVGERAKILPGGGPLFVNLDRRGASGRLTGTGLYLMIRELGRRVGIHARPHGLRHAAITAALDGGSDVRSVQRFSRHRDLRVLTLYDDNRADLGGAVASRLAASL